jgi:CubicO group peptidase (beta-lactamase class C family)
MVRTGEVALADPVAKCRLPAARLPERNGRAITLVDLATHTSGLPFMHDEPIVLGDSAAAKYGTRQLDQFLARYALSREIGADWDYSNIGYWLLGEALASRAGTNFLSLLETRICRPLQLKSTACTVSPSLKARLAVGHDASLQLAPLFSATSVYAAMPAAGGLVSTVNDLLNVLAVAMGYEDSALAPSMAAMLATRRPLGPSEQALGWVVTGKGDDQLILHDGFTWGYASYVAWDPTHRVGVVVLSNQITDVGDIAQHLLRPKVPLERPPATNHTATKDTVTKHTVSKNTEITLAPSVLDAYAGRFATEGEGLFNITRIGDFLTLQLPIGWGLPTFRLRPQSRRDFFVAELPIRVTFQPDSAGQMNELLLYPPRGQHAIAVKRIR